MEFLIATDRLDEALTTGYRALRQHEEAGRRVVTMRLRLLLGRVHAALGDLDVARPLWRDALAYAISESVAPERAELERLLGLSGGTCTARPAGT